MILMIISYDIKYHFVNALVFFVLIACVIEIVQIILPSMPAMLVDFGLHVGGVVVYLRRIFNI